MRRYQAAARKLLVALSIASMMGPPGLANSSELNRVADEQAEKADELREATTKVVRDMVGALDAFFVTEDFGTFEENQTRMRLRLNLDHLENHGFDVKPRFKLGLALPRLNQRLRLVVNDGDGLDGEQTTSEEENDVAIRWIARQSKARSLNFDLGFRIKGGEADPFTRLNAGLQYPIGDDWHLQTTNRLYYYSQTGWRNDLRQYLNRPLGEKLLFRARTRVQYFEENTANPNLEQKFSLYQTLQKTAAIAYEAIWRRESFEDSLFDEDEIVDEPQKSYQNVLLRVRYRRSFWRPWFYVEFWPTIGWAEERDWETLLGARVRFEINYGSQGELRLDE